MLLDIYSERGREGGESHARVSAHRFCRNKLLRGRQEQEGSEKPQFPQVYKLWGALGFLCPGR